MSNPKIYVTADTHFGHKKIIEFEKEFRPYTTIEDHDRDLVARWNAVVKPKDTVWHLGDVYFGGAANHDILGQLNGIKKLVLGNHDIYPLEIYQKYFTKIYGAFVFSGSVLTHVPVHPSQLGSRFAYNVHGHTHHNTVESVLGRDPRYLCVSLEQTNLAPIELRVVLNSAARG